MPPNDPRSLADATLRLLSNSALRAKLGQHARSIVVMLNSPMIEKERRIFGIKWYGDEHLWGRDPLHFD